MAPQGPNPFPGLRPFRETDASVFFGRDRQITELLQRLFRSRLLAVVGTSGCGKSSLIYAGFLPRLRSGFDVHRRPGWRIAVMRPGNDPIAALADALADEDALGDQPWLRETLDASSHGLLEATRRSGLDPDENLLVVVDQFEEIFRYRTHDAAGVERSIAFVNLLLSATASTEPVWVLLTMRSDFLGECAQFRGLPEAINENQYLVPRMTRDEMREAILAPLLLRKVEIDPALVERLLNDAGDQPDSLPVLQHVLMRMWDAWKDAGDDAIGMHHYQTVGTISEAVQRHATAVMMGLVMPWPGAGPPLAKVTLRRIFQRLTDRTAGSRDTRRPCSAAELAAVAGVDLATIERVFDAFSAEGRTLLTASDLPLTPQSLVDITHESLIRLWVQLSIWIDEEVRAVTEYERILGVARLHVKRSTLPMLQAELWRGKDLARANEWEKTFHESLGAEWYDAAHAWSLRYTSDPNDFRLAMDFLRQSREAEWWRRIGARASIALLCVAVAAFAGLAWWAWSLTSRLESLTAQTAGVASAAANLAELNDATARSERALRAAQIEVRRAEADREATEADVLKAQTAAREALDRFELAKRDADAQQREVETLRKAAAQATVDSSALRQVLAEVDSFRSRVTELEQRNRELEQDIATLKAAASDSSDKPDPVLRKALDDLGRAQYQLATIKQWVPEVVVLEEERPYSLRSAAFRQQVWVVPIDIEPDRVELQMVFTFQPGLSPSNFPSYPRWGEPTTRVFKGEGDRFDFSEPGGFSVGGSVRLVIAKVDDRLGPKSDSVTIVVAKVFP